jgi:hypothetical protein
MLRFFGVALVILLSSCINRKSRTMANGIKPMTAKDSNYQKQRELTTKVKEPLFFYVITSQRVIFLTHWLKARIAA